MKTVLAPADYYLPGYKAGGALRSLANVVRHLRDDFSFRIVTRDRDWLESEPYPDIRRGEWMRRDGADVLYLAPAAVHPMTLLRLLRRESYDVLYLNSLFSRVMTLSVLAFRRLGLLPRVPVILAPRGQLSPGAIGIRERKKETFIAIANRLGLYQEIIWQASTNHEASEIREYFERDSTNPIRVVVAPDLPALDARMPPSTQKRVGELNVVWYSRIARKKNLRGALEVLAGIAEPVTLDLYGPVEDQSYWDECRSYIATLPSHIVVRYRGALRYEEVVSTLARHDLFLFPSLGENFGHVILEALAGGCPVLVSDQTAFRGLEAAGAGWDLPVTDLEGFRARVRECIAMDREKRDRIAERAVQLARTFLDDERAVDANRALFRDAIEERADGPPAVRHPASAGQNIA